MVITIDGPAASGKSSVSRELAKQFNGKWLSTGAFYRGLGYAAKKEGVDSADESALADLALSSIWSVEMLSENTQILYRGQDVTKEAQSQEAGMMASEVSKFPLVRANLLQAQRECANNTKLLVAEGRDCGSVVFPSAQIKIYLTASSQERAQRRAKQFGLNESKVHQEQELRDKQDSERKSAPLQIPEDAHVINSGNLQLDEVIHQAVEIVRKNLSPQASL